MNLKDMLTKGRVVEITYDNSKCNTKIGLIDMLDNIQHHEGFQPITNYNENLENRRSGCKITKIYENTEGGLKLIWDRKDFIDWSTVEVDTPILVKNSRYGDWHKRHFAMFEEGIIYAWNKGTTSKTANFGNSVSTWEYAKLNTEEGLKPIKP